MNKMSLVVDQLKVLSTITFAIAKVMCYRKT